MFIKSSSYRLPKPSFNSRHPYQLHCPFMSENAKIQIDFQIMFYYQTKDRVQVTQLKILIESR